VIEDIVSQFSVESPWKTRFSSGQSVRDFLQKKTQYGRHRKKTSPQTLIAPVILYPLTAAW
jgi:hypothetical protein